MYAVAYSRSMAATPLHRVLRDVLKVSDADFAGKAGLSRVHVHSIRTGQKVPRADTAVRILAALKKLGVEMTLADLIRRPSHKAA